ncbi:unnamed protein product, partial [Closterium sp. Naga37s-1]
RARQSDKGTEMERRGRGAHYGTETEARAFESPHRSREAERQGHGDGEARGAHYGTETEVRFESTHRSREAERQGHGDGEARGAHYGTETEARALSRLTGRARQSDKGTEMERRGAWGSLRHGDGGARFESPHRSREAERQGHRDGEERGVGLTTARRRRRAL